MKFATHKIRPPIKRHGGKNYLARRIVSLFPQHRTYIEPYLGGGSVLLAKPKSTFEFAGDLDAGLMNLWRHIRCPESPLFGMLSAVDYTEDRFDAACEAHPEDGGVYGALCFLVRNRFSRGGLGKTFAWSDRLRGGQPGDVNAWETIKGELPAIAERVRDVEFQCGPALPLILNHDSHNTLTYCDPPYCHSARTAKKTYLHEMTGADHTELLAVLDRCKGTVVLSGYRNALYDERLKEWSRIDVDMPNHSGQGSTKQRRVECLWSNRPFPAS